MATWQRLDDFHPIFTSCDPIGGYGKSLGAVLVTEPGDGFPQKGVFALMDWQYLDSRDGFNHDDDEPYASIPYFLGDNLDEAQRFIESSFE